MEAGERNPSHRRAMSDFGTGGSRSNLYVQAPPCHVSVHDRACTPQDSNKLGMLLLRNDTFLAQ